MNPAAPAPAAAPVTPNAPPTPTKGAPPPTPAPKGEAAPPKGADPGKPAPLTGKGDAPVVPEGGKAAPEPPKPGAEGGEKVPEEPDRSVKKVSEAWDKLNRAEASLRERAKALEAKEKALAEPQTRAEKLAAYMERLERDPFEAIALGDEALGVKPRNPREVLEKWLKGEQAQPPDPKITEHEKQLAEVRAELEAIKREKIEAQGRAAIEALDKEIGVVLEADTEGNFEVLRALESAGELDAKHEIRATILHIWEHGSEKLGLPAGTRLPVDEAAKILETHFVTKAGGLYKALSSVRKFGTVAPVTPDPPPSPPPVVADASGRPPPTPAPTRKAPKAALVDRSVKAIPLKKEPEATTPEELREQRMRAAMAKLPADWV